MRRIFMFLFIGVLSLEASSKRIAFLNFSNQTGSADYDYLSESLKIAVIKSMRKTFHYTAVTKSAISEQSNAALASFPSNKSLKKLCKESRLDAVVYGKYLLKGSKLHIYSIMYLQNGQKTIKPSRVVTRTNSALFKSVAISAKRMAQKAAALKTKSGASFLKKRKQRATSKKVKKKPVRRKEPKKNKRKYNVELGPFKF